MNTIKFYIKSVYGNDHQYIADKEQAALISKLTGLKTLLPEQQKALEKLGLVFEEILPPKDK